MAFEKISLSRYRCRCQNCGASWTTKTLRLPKVCSKCKTITWNNDASVTALPPEPVLKQPPKGLPSPSVEPKSGSSIEEWAFTKDRPQYADDGNIYRQQYLVSDPKKLRQVRVDEDDVEIILAIKK